MPTHRQPPSPTPPYSSIIDFDKYVNVESEDRRLLEMKLMHQFITQTVTRGFFSTHDEDVMDLWLHVAPTLALDHPFLMNIIMSIAALHITKIHPERQDMADIHRTYFNAAISQHRHAVRDIGPHNAEALCISTVLIGLPAFTLLQNTEIGTYSPPLQLFYLLAAHSPLFNQAVPYIPKDSKVISFIAAKPNIWLFVDEVRKDVYQRPFAQLANWRAQDEVVDLESQDAYGFVLGYIGCILFQIDKGEDPCVLRRMFYGMPSVVPPAFVSRLKENNPRALTILAYFFSLAKGMDNVWWMRGIAEREVFGIQSILPENWQWAMSWPLQKLAYYAQFAAPPMHHMAPNY